MMAAPTLSRRNFLRGRLNSSPDPIRPPWSCNSSVFEECVRCRKCADACPERIIGTDADGYPEISFTSGECTFCRACAEVCPAPVFAPSDSEPWQLSLHVGKGCLVKSKVFCRSCGDACPESAIRFRPTLGGSAELSIDCELCTGCGACISVCPANVLSLTPRMVQSEAT